MEIIKNTLIATTVLSIVISFGSSLSITEAAINSSFKTTSSTTVSLSSNSSNLKVISSKLEYKTVPPQSDGQFHDGLLFAEKSDGSLLFYNTSGKEAFTLSKNLIPAGDFHEQRALVKDSAIDLYGYINTKGKLVVVCSYIEASNFSEGIAYVKKNKEDNGSFINTAGNQTVILERAYDSDFNFKDGLALAYSKNSDKIGYLNKAGSIVVPYKYNYGRAFSEDLAVVQDSNENYGYINKNGKTMIALKYKSAGDFSEGLAPVQDEKGKWGFINQKGTLIIPFQFSSAESFSEGLAAVYNQKGKVGFINKNGKLIINFQKYNKASQFHNGIALVGIKTNTISKFGYIDQKGKLLTKIDYTSGMPFSEGYGLIINSSKYASILSK